MSNKKISELTDGGALQATDEIPVERGGNNFRVAGSEFGGSQPVKQERINEITLTTAGGPLNWAHSFGDVLLDYSDPTGPTVIAAGTYALSVFARITGTITGGTYLYFDVEMDSDGDDWDIHNVCPVVPDAVASSRTQVGVALIAKIPAGAILRANTLSDVIVTNGATALQGQLIKLL